MQKDTPPPPPPPFVNRGNFVAMPLCFPGVTVPIPADDAYVSRLTSHPTSPAVLGATDGDRSHVFMAAPKPPFGYVIDLGVPYDACRTRGLFTVKHAFEDVSEETRKHSRDRTGYSLVAALNSADHGMLATLPVPFPPEGIQEWGFRQPSFSLLKQFDHEKILDACPAADGMLGILLTEHRLLALDMKGAVTEIAAADHLSAQPGLIAGNCAPNEAYCFNTDAELLRIVPETLELETTGAALPATELGEAATLVAPGQLLVSDNEGYVYSMDAQAGQTASWPSPGLAPLQTLAALPDGRVFGVCGRDVGRMFEIAAAAEQSVDLGVPAAVLGNKRYGYAFSPALTGADGEIYFGEYDRGGHLWVYYPALQPINRAATC